MYGRQYGDLGSERVKAMIGIIYLTLVLFLWDMSFILLYFGHHFVHFKPRITIFILLAWYLCFIFFCLCIPKVPDQKMKSSSQMTVCVRATLWDSALMNSLTTQWVACYDVCIPPKVNILQILFCYLTTGWNG